MAAFASVATQQSDAALQRRYSAMGRAAFKAGAARQCRIHPTSMLAAFWCQGWDEEAASYDALPAADHPPRLGG